jgi:hypothetical protein
LRAESTNRWTLRILGFVGLGTFLFFFSLTWYRPQWVEDFAADYLQAEVLAYSDARIDAIRAPAGDGALAQLAGELFRRNQAEIEDLKNGLKARVREYLLAAITQARDPDCPCRERLAELLQAGADSRLARLALDNQQLVAFIQSNYLERVAALKQELRVFTGINAACFLFLLVLSFAKPAAARHLLFPGVLLAIATLFCAWLYVTSQDWLLAIVHGNYVGWAYAGWLGLVFLFLCDIALNRGRVTTRLANGVINGMGSAAASFTPC